MLSKGVHGCLGLVDSFSFLLVALKLPSLRKPWYTCVSHVSADWTSWTMAGDDPFGWVVLKVSDLTKFNARKQ